MSQEEFAFRINVSRQTVYFWENGKVIPDTSKLLLICKEFNIDINKLICVNEVFEEIISPDNVMRMGELLALQSLKFMCGHKHLHRMYANLARDIDYKDIPGYVLTDSYDLAQSAALFLLDYMGKSVYDTCIDKY